MTDKNLTFSGGLILGAGLACLLQPGRVPGAQRIAGALGFAAAVFGAALIAKLGRGESSTSTALDIDAPDYAWLR
jgi:hypothetical protein